ncbi:hypothetical protein EHYA_04527 [Embleya hyalina]|uniref:Uncharacterized protein n=1 Tax=Embleya hyalina TaxID=516124 RepID=A0A401YQF9_9ACTN|nr:hypothetical protein EHYA_04527 [Embleya hyalina]
MGGLGWGTTAQRRGGSHDGQPDERFAITESPGRAEAAGSTSLLRIVHVFGLSPRRRRSRGAETTETDPDALVRDFGDAADGLEPTCDASDRRRDRFSATAMRDAAKLGRVPRPESRDGATIRVRRLPRCVDAWRTGQRPHRPRGARHSRLPGGPRFRIDEALGRRLQLAAVVDRNAALHGLAVLVDHGQVGVLRDRDPGAGGEREIPRFAVEPDGIGRTGVHQAAAGAGGTGLDGPPRSTPCRT